MELFVEDEPPSKLFTVSVWKPALEATSVIVDSVNVQTNYTDPRLLSTLPVTSLMRQLGREELYSSFDAELNLTVQEAYS